MLRRIRALEGDRDLLLRVAERCRDDVLAAQAVLHRTAASLDLPSLFRGSAGMGGPLPAGLAPGCCLSAVPAPVDGRLAQDEGSAGGATRSHISSAPGGTEEGAVRRGLPGPGVEVGVPLSALHLLGEEPRGGNGSAVLCSARPTTARTGGGEAGRRVSGRNLEMYQDGWLSTVPGSALRPELGPIGSGHLEGSTEGGVDRHPSGLNPALCAGQGDRPQAGVLPETKGGREGEGPQHPLDSAGQPQPKARPGASRGPVAPLRRAVPLVLQAAGPPWCGGVAVVPVAGLQSPPVGVQFACDDARGNVGSSPPWVPAHGAAAASPPARIPLEFAAGGQEEKPAAAPQKQQQQASACSTRTGIGGRADKLPPPRLTGRRALRALDGNSAAAFGVAPRKRQVSAQQVGVSRLQCRGAVVNTNSNSNSGNNSNNNNNNNNNNNECIVVAAGGKRAGANPLRTASARLRAVRRKSSKLP
ncbi:hypothetical protein DIPPA_10835 [Diplonema papillatum]|nr:hypothetical protein DIPPA_10835 [Diplonema papillatum]